MKSQCCVCHAVKRADAWVQHDRAVAGASHTYCPACLEAESRKLRRETTLAGAVAGFAPAK